MMKMRRSFADEFKRAAVALLEGSGRPLEHVARELGLQASVLRNWRVAQGHPARSRSGMAAPGTAMPAKPDERTAEIARLRRELERARQERDIIKRPSASSRKRRDEAPLHRGPPGRVPGLAHVHGARDRTRVETREQARREVFAYIETFYNRQHPLGHRLLHARTGRATIRLNPCLPNRGKIIISIAMGLDLGPSRGHPRRPHPARFAHSPQGGRRRLSITHIRQHRW